MKTYNVTPILPLIRSAKTAFIAVSQGSIDSIAAALALAVSLKAKGIQTQVFCSQKPDQNYAKLSGLELLSDTYNSNDLTISLNYPLDQIDQVSYNDDGGRLNLVVKTKPNAVKVESNQIIVNNQSSLADINFLFGDDSALGTNANIVNRGDWVLVSPLPLNKAWAKGSIIDPDAPFSEIISFLLPMLNLDTTYDTAKNLLIGLRVATQSFSVNVSPETFEAGAACLRATQMEAPSATPLNQSTSGQSNIFDQQVPVENVEKSANLFSSPQPGSVSTV